MATHPIVRNAEEDIQSPEELEALIGPGVLPEHRAILLHALTTTSNRGFIELLLSMPNVGEDSDFAPNRG
ncbi:MAG: hypothetical protein ABR991_10795 [Terracidiphilus sp.]|jgi:hypothetical protein